MSPCKNHKMSIIKRCLRQGSSLTLATAQTESYYVIMSPSLPEDYLTVFLWVSPAPAPPPAELKPVCSGGGRDR
jgi:hypothetical protein